MLTKTLKHLTEKTRYTDRMVLVAAITHQLRKQDATIKLTEVSAAIKKFKINLPLVAPADQTRQDKLANDVERRLHIKRLRAITPERYQVLVDRIERGSRAASDKLGCLQCANYCVAEIRHCGLMDCAHWWYRPFRPRNR